MTANLVLKSLTTSPSNPALLRMKYPPVNVRFREFGASFNQAESAGRSQEFTYEIRRSLYEQPVVTARRPGEILRPVLFQECSPHLTRRAKINLLQRVCSRGNRVPQEN